jgi:PIN domain nuclease of toxin-antitoxin system
MADRVVLDAHAVLAFLTEEPGLAEVDEVLRTGEPWMTLVNLGEVAYVLERSSGRAAADEVWANLRAESRPGGVPVRWLDVNDDLVRRAAGIKALGGISFADTFAAAAASSLGCPVLTGDPEFCVAEEAGVSVRWLGRRAWPSEILYLMIPVCPRL